MSHHFENRKKKAKLAERIPAESRAKSVSLTDLPSTTKKNFNSGSKNSEMKRMDSEDLQIKRMESKDLETIEFPSASSSSKKAKRRRSKSLKFLKTQTTSSSSIGICLGPALLTMYDSRDEADSVFKWLISPVENERFFK